MTVLSLIDLNQSGPSSLKGNVSLSRRALGKPIPFPFADTHGKILKKSFT
jgi:hypothetical protein